MSEGFELLERLERTSSHYWTGPDANIVWRRWGNGPAVVLIHGGYGSWTHWIRTLPAVARHHAALAVDLPGFGDSAMPEGEVTLDSLAESVAAGLKEILQNTEPYHLVGFSFGGAVSGALAIKDEERIRSLTLVAPAGLARLRPPVALQQWRHLASAEAQAGVHRKNLQALMIASFANIDELAVRVQAANAMRGRIRTREITWDPSLASLLPTIRIPLRVIYGDHDPTVYPRMLARKLEFEGYVPDAEFRVVKDAGHWVQYERPATFNALLLEFLAKHAKSRGGREIRREYHGTMEETR